MIIPLNVPTAADLPRPPAQLPARFKLTDADGTTRMYVGCPMCGRHVEVNKPEYDAEVEPICSECELTAAEMSGWEGDF